MEIQIKLESVVVIKKEEDSSSKHQIKMESASTFQNHVGVGSDINELDDYSESDESIEILDEEKKVMDDPDPEIVFECYLCKQIMASRRSLVRHIQTEHIDSGETDSEIYHGSQSGIQCFLCPQVISTAKGLLSHLEKSHGDCQEIEPRPGGYKCEICSKNLRNAKCFAEHKKTHRLLAKTAGKKVPTPKSKSKSKKRISSTSKHQPPPAKFQCGVCLKILMDRTQLKSHQKYYHGDKRHKCHLCEKTWGTKYLLEKHLRSHSSDLPFRCNQCLKCLKTNKSLVKHKQRFHSSSSNKIPFKRESRFKKEKPVSKHLVFGCCLCPFQSSEHTEVAIHNELHSLPKVLLPKDMVCKKHSKLIAGKLKDFSVIWKCHRCFQLESSTQKFRIKRTIQPRFQCPNCPKWFLTESTLKNKHMKIHLIEDAYRCSACLNQYASINSLNIHKTRCQLWNQSD